jgi:hypothetical protein
LLLATVILFTLFRFIGPDKPNVVEFELAGNSAKSQAIVDAWSPVDRIHAGFSLGIDYLFMPLYSTTIALALIWAAGVLSAKRWRSIGLALAWGCGWRQSLMQLKIWRWSKLYSMRPRSIRGRRSPQPARRSSLR